MAKEKILSRKKNTKPIPAKFKVVRLDRTVDFEATLRKVLIAYANLEKQLVGKGGALLIADKTPDSVQTPVENLLTVSINMHR